MKGFGSLVSLVIALAFVIGLVLLYMRGFRAASPEAAHPKTTLDGVRRQADAVEEQQKERFRALDELGSPPE